MCHAQTPARSSRSFSSLRDRLYRNKFIKIIIYASPFVLGAGERVILDASCYFTLNKISMPHDFASERFYEASADDFHTLFESDGKLKHKKTFAGLYSQFMGFIFIE